jgi:protein O-GlcNAc transferase
LPSRRERSILDPMGETMAEALHLYRSGHLREAELVCEAIVARDPACGEAWDRLARIAELQNHPEQAEACYERAVSLLANPAEAHNNLGVLLQRRGDFERALPHYQRALALGLRHALLHSNLGCLLRDLGHLQDGVAELQRALEIDPSSGQAHSNLGVALALQGRIDDALAHLRLAVALQPDWDLAHSNLLFCLNYAANVTPVEIAAQHRAFGARHPAPEGLAPITDPDPDRKLRIGFVSPDLKQHSVAYFIEPLFNHYDRTAFEYFCYSDVIRPDIVTQRMQAQVDRWRPIRGLADPDVARLIHADRVDILIDLAGHTANNRMSLFAARAAPVQMTFLGYPNSTGVESMDWRITDGWADPPGMTEALHSEELLRLPHGFLCFGARDVSPDEGPLPARASGRVTFGSFNLPAKISPVAIELWAAILDRVPGARLCLKGPAFADPPTRAIFERRLAESPLGRHTVELMPHFAKERDHLAAYGRIDIALDTWPYAGTTTTCEALWMGVPVITLAGRTHASRVGASLLSRIGENDLIADTPAGYVDAAVRLAGDRDRLEALRGSLRGRMVSSGITDGAGYARAFGGTLRQAWQIGCEKRRAAELPLPAGQTLAPLVGNLRVVVEDREQEQEQEQKQKQKEDRLDQITPYVLREQHDWFEDEIGFVRALLARGERAIDIGANHGVYALTLAGKVGFSGRVWAFEPGHDVAARLRLSIAVNRFPQLSLIEAALSNREGTGQLDGGAQSELGSLRAGAGSGDGDGAGAGGETVTLFTLDGCAARLGLTDVAFVKIDAEGAEADIVEGGRAFFARESPLVMFEVRHGAAVNLHMVERFEALGYRAYRLLPGLGVLAPLDRDDLAALDPFTLNMFACKPDRARHLAQRALLVEADPTAKRPGATAGPPPDPDEPFGAWPAYLRSQLFAAPLWPRWAEWDQAAADPSPLDAAYRRCLNHFAYARRITEPPAVRAAHLASALRIGSACARDAPTIPVLQTLARITWEAGARAVAVQALNLLVERCAAHQPLVIDRPFLAVSPRFDDLPPHDADDDAEVGRWILAAALEQRERLRAFSSFYTRADPATLACLEMIAGLGYQSPEMARRLDLVRSGL